MVSKRYSCPSFVIDSAIENRDFDKWVRFFIYQTNQEEEDKYMWEFYLHKVYDMTFTEFQAEVDRSKNGETAMTKTTKEAIIQNSKNILNEFKPTGGKNDV